jgi:hypothetical protein
VQFDDPTDQVPQRRRAGGNSGHAQIDFGGQWLMGRMIVLGHGRELYHRQRQWEVARAGFPVEDEPLVDRVEASLPRSLRQSAGKDETPAHDAENLMSWVMGHDPEEWKLLGGAVAAPAGPDPFGGPLLTAALAAAADRTVTPEVAAKLEEPAIGGPLYPPIHGFFYAPVGAFDDPQLAYRTFQVFACLLTVACGLAVTILSRGRIWWSVATLVLYLFPGTRPGLDLGQNPTLTLSIALWGWVLASRGYQVAGGVVWGLFAFKPVWGLAFFLIPLLTRRWRFCAAMAATGCGLVAATLPFVGFQTWLDWLHVGKDAADLYNVNYNWIHLSRDVQSVPRRILHDFSAPAAERDTPLAMGLAWGLWGAILATTVGVFLRYGDRTRGTGVGVAFLFFAAYLTCYRFMYYDALLAAAGCAVLLADPWRFLRPRPFRLALSPPTDPFPPSRELTAPPPPVAPFLGARNLGYFSSFPLTMLACLLIYQNVLSGWGLRATVVLRNGRVLQRGVDGVTSLVPPQVEVETSILYPWETAVVFALWVWCAVMLVRGAERSRAR